MDNSRTLRLPTHLHERLGLIRNAKLRLQEKGITPSVDVSMFFLTFHQFLAYPVYVSHALYCLLFPADCRVTKHVSEES